jgi:hypothetical protein
MRVAAALIAIMASDSAFGDVPSLCGAQEKILFSCQTRKGVASICQGKAVSEPTVTYRFGQLAHVQLSHPEEPVSPAKAFTAGTLSFSGGGGSYVQFAKSGFQYTIFTAVGRWGIGDKAASVAGVAVRQGDKEVSNLACVGPVRSELGPALFEKSGLKADTSGSFEIPEAFFPK